MPEKLVEIHETSGDDAVLRVAIPVDEAAKGYRLLVRITPETAPPIERDANGWPTGYLDKLVGSWADDFVEESEGPFEERETF